MSIENIRNIGVIAHIDAGKTTLTERLLFYTEKIHRMGEVHKGTATMDYMPEEQERGITITAACTSCEWKNYTLNIIDTPGHVDFTIEVERSLRVLDGAVAVFCAVAGVEAQSETVWRQSEHFKVPKLIFINKIDRIGADFKRTLEEIKSRLNTNPFPITIPLSDYEESEDILHLLLEQKLHFDEENQGQTIDIVPLDEKEKKILQELRENLLEKLAESDELFLEQYLNLTYSDTDIHKAIARATQARLITPVFVGSALKNKGIQPLLDAITLYLPSPKERHISAHNPNTGNEVIIEPDANAFFAALAFKINILESRKLVFLRLYSGILKEGDTLYNVNQDISDRVQRIFRLHADKHEQLEQALAGDIIAVLGLKSARTGDTYTIQNKNLLLENLNSYKPVITLALEPRNSEEGKTLDLALARYLEEDPTLSLSLDEGSGHRIVSGMGELHLEVLLEKIKREYNIEPRSGQAQVIYRETIKNTATGSGLFERELGNTLHHGFVALTIVPHVTEEHDNTVRLAFDASLLPKVIVDNVVTSLQDSLLSSPSGYALQDILVEINDIQKNENTSPAGCQMAASLALRDALEKAQTRLLEPIMYVEITVPEDFLGNIISAFSTRNGKIENLLEVPHSPTIKKLIGKAPLSQLFGFATTLRSASQGRATLITKFEDFQ